MFGKGLRVWVSVLVGLGLVALALLLTGATSAKCPVASSGGPDAPVAVTASSWSSGWFTMSRGSSVTLTHGLGADPDEYLVQMWFWDTDGGKGINCVGYGGLEVGGSYFGAAWQNLTGDTIQVIRYADDTFADRILVRVWVPLTEFDYCSPWTTVGQGETQVFTHNLGGSPDDYSVGLEFRNATIGVNQRAYGGLEYGSGSAFLGAYWSHLTTDTVRVFRFASDVFAGQVRVCVTTPGEPDYDSGWVTVTQNSTLTLNHDLGGYVGMYKVRLDEWVSSLGINHRYFGGEFENVTPDGANWENLTTRTIEIYSRYTPSRVRIRIWTQKRVYLPLVLNGYAQTTELSYDDGTRESEQSFAALDSGFAVRFSPPNGAATLVQARYYLDAAAANHPVQVHVWDAEYGDLVTPFTVTPEVGEGWLDVDLSEYGLTVDEDFYVGFLYSAQHSDPSIGVDTSAPDGRSYEVPWEQKTGGDYMIRAVIR